MQELSAPTGEQEPEAGLGSKVLVLDQTMAVRLKQRRDKRKSVGCDKGRKKKKVTLTANASEPANDVTACGASMEEQLSAANERNEAADGLPSSSKPCLVRGSCQGQGTNADQQLASTADAITPGKQPRAEDTQAALQSPPRTYSRAIRKSPWSAAMAANQQHLAASAGPVADGQQQQHADPTANASSLGEQAQNDANQAAVPSPGGTPSTQIVASPAMTRSVAARRQLQPASGSIGDIPSPAAGEVPSPAQQLQHENSIAFTAAKEECFGIVSRRMQTRSRHSDGLVADGIPEASAGPSAAAHQQQPPKEKASGRLASSSAAARKRSKSQQRSSETGRPSAEDRAGKVPLEPDGQPAAPAGDALPSVAGQAGRKGKKLRQQDDQPPRLLQDPNLAAEMQQLPDEEACAPLGSKAAQKRSRPKRKPCCDAQPGTEADGLTGAGRSATEAGDGLPPAEGTHLRKGKKLSCRIGEPFVADRQSELSVAHPSTSAQHPPEGSNASAKRKGRVSIGKKSSKKRKKPANADQQVVSLAGSPSLAEQHTSHGGGDMPLPGSTCSGAPRNDPHASQCEAGGPQAAAGDSDMPNAAQVHVCPPSSIRSPGKPVSKRPRSEIGSAHPQQPSSQADAEQSGVLNSDDLQQQQQQLRDASAEPSHGVSHAQNQHDQSTSVPASEPSSEAAAGADPASAKCQHSEAERPSHVHSHVQTQAMQGAASSPMDVERPQEETAPLSGPESAELMQADMQAPSAKKRRRSESEGSSKAKAQRSSSGKDADATAAGPQKAGKAKISEGHKEDSLKPNSSANMPISNKQRPRSSSRADGPDASGIQQGGQSHAAKPSEAAQAAARAAQDPAARMATARDFDDPQASSPTQIGGQSHATESMDLLAQTGPQLNETTGSPLPPADASGMLLSMRHAQPTQQAHPMQVGLGAAGSVNCEGNHAASAACTEGLIPKPTARAEMAAVGQNSRPMVLPIALTTGATCEHLPASCPYQLQASEEFDSPPLHGPQPVEANTPSQIALVGRMGTHDVCQDKPEHDIVPTPSTQHAPGPALAASGDAAIPSSPLASAPAAENDAAGQAVDGQQNDAMGISASASALGAAAATSHGRPSLAARNPEKMSDADGQAARRDAVRKAGPQMPPVMTTTDNEQDERVQQARAGELLATAIRACTKEANAMGREPPAPVFAQAEGAARARAPTPAQKPRPGVPSAPAADGAEGRADDEDSPLERRQLIDVLRHEMATASSELMQAKQSHSDTSELCQQLEQQESKAQLPKVSAAPAPGQGVGCEGLPAPLPLRSETTCPPASHQNLQPVTAVAYASQAMQSRPSPPPSHVHHRSMSAPGPVQGWPAPDPLRLLPDHWQLATRRSSGGHHHTAPDVASQGDPFAAPQEPHEHGPPIGLAGYREQHARRWQDSHGKHRHDSPQTQAPARGMLSGCRHVTPPSAGLQPACQVRPSHSGGRSLPGQLMTHRHDWCDVSSSLESPLQVSQNPARMPAGPQFGRSSIFAPQVGPDPLRFHTPVFELSVFLLIPGHWCP